MNNYFDVIRPDKLTEAKTKVAQFIKKESRRAAALCAIAGALDGAYVTKRLEAKILPLLPGAEHVNLHKELYVNYIELTISYPEIHRYDDYPTIRICDTEKRRIDGKKLLTDAEMIESGIREKELNLSRLDAVAAIYNNLADQYARIYSVLNDCMYYDVPRADYDLQRKYKDADPLQKPAPAPAKIYSFEEFAAAIAE